MPKTPNIADADWADKEAFDLSLVCQSYENGSCTNQETGEQVDPCYCSAVAAALRAAYERGKRRQAFDALAKLDGKSL